jgi:hypothetical protein
LPKRSVIHWLAGLELLEAPLSLEGSLEVVEANSGGRGIGNVQHVDLIILQAGRDASSAWQRNLFQVKLCLRASFVFVRQGNMLFD